MEQDQIMQTSHWMARETGLRSYICQRLLELQRGPVVTQWNTLQKRPHH